MVMNWWGETIRDRTVIVMLDAKNPFVNALSPGRFPPADSTFALYRAWMTGIWR